MVSLRTVASAIWVILGYTHMSHMVPSMVPYMILIWYQYVVSVHGTIYGIIHGIMLIERKFKSEVLLPRPHKLAQHKIDDFIIVFLL